MRSTTLLVVVALVFQASQGAERKRLENEIRPVSAVQSRTKNNDVAKYGAMRGIDGDQATAAYIQKSTDPIAWYKVKFDSLHCIDEIKWFWGSTGSTVLTWNCNESGCGRCTGHSKCNDHSMKVLVNAQDSNPNNLPPSLNCLYADSFELQNNGDFWMYEIAFTGRKVQTEIVDACEKEKEELEQALNDNILLKNELRDLEGQLLDAHNKTEDYAKRLDVEAGKVAEANKYITILKTELDKARTGLEDLEGQLLDAHNKTEDYAKRLDVEAGKVAEANKYITELKTELDKARADAEKSACPGQGIWTVPDNVIGKKISGKMMKTWKKDKLKDNQKYLKDYKGVKITKDIARYIECFQTVA